MYGYNKITTTCTCKSVALSPGCLPLRNNIFECASPRSKVKQQIHNASMLCKGESLGTRLLSS